MSAGKMELLQYLRSKKIGVLTKLGMEGEKSE